MKTILYRYLFRELSSTFLFSLVIFTLVIFMGKILQLAELVFSNGVSLYNILKLFTYLLPSFCLITVPMSFLLGVLLTFSRLSSDNEITAIKSSGISLLELLPPVMATAALAYILTAFITAYALPWGQNSFRKLMFDFLDTTQKLNLKDGIFNDQFPGLVLYAEHLDPKDSSMDSIIIHDSRDGQVPSTIFARHGIIQRDQGQRSVRLHLADGSIHQNMPNLGYRLISFDGYDVVISFTKPLPPAVFDERYMNFSELRASLNRPLARKIRQDFLNEYHRRIALPFAPFGFALLGTALGIQNRRTGRSGGFAFCIAILLVYYVLLSFGTTLSYRQTIPGWLAIWSPNILSTVFGLWLFSMSAKEKQYSLFENWSTLLNKIRTHLIPGRNH